MKDMSKVKTRNNRLRNRLLQHITSIYHCQYDLRISLIILDKPQISCTYAANWQYGATPGYTKAPSPYSDGALSYGACGQIRTPDLLITNQGKRLFGILRCYSEVFDATHY
jgi:hypothetical protein